MKRLFVFSLFFFMVCAHPVIVRAANKANVMLVPTRVVMENDTKSATVELKNPGTATGQYSVGLVDMDMQESGAIVQLEEGQSEEFSAIPYLHISPKSITLGPGESQTIRIMQKRNLKPEPGEYRAHLRVKMENENVEGAEAAQGAQPNQTETAISVKANLVLVIPVLVRVGETSYTISIEKPKLSFDLQGKPKIEMYLARDGNRSCIGDFSVAYRSPSGTEKLITFYPGVPVYRPTPRRFVSVPLDVPPGVDLKQGSLEISYSAQEKEGGKLLAQKSLPLE